MNFTTVPGKNTKHSITLFALSTCGWCRRTKELLDSQSVEYRFVYVDKCEQAEQTEAKNRVRELNPRGSYPTLQIDDQVIAGFDEERILEVLS